MEMYNIFDNVINKDFMTYESVFNEMVDWWYFNKDENVLILSDNIDYLSRTLYDILKKNKRVDGVTMRCYSDKYVIRLVSYSHRIERHICLNFNIMDIKMFSSFSSRGMRWTDVIFDVDAESLENIKLPFGEDIINKIIRPMMVVPKSYRGNFLTLLY